MPVIHEDAIDTAFVTTQLESVLSKLYIEYPATPYSSIVPVDSSDHEGADYVGYIQYDSVGASAIVAEGTTDSPAVDMFAKKIMQPVHELGNHFSYTRKELRQSELSRQSQYGGVELDVERPKVASMVIEQHHDEICMLGDGTNDKRFAGMYGVVFHPNFTKMSSPKTFASATDAEIMSYFASMVTRIGTDTKQVFRPNTFAIAQEVIDELSARMISGTDTSLWDRIKRTYSNFSFENHYVLNNVGKNPTTLAVTPTRVIICYHKSPNVLRYKQPMPFKTYAPVDKGRSWQVECASTSGGVEARQPLAVVIFHSF